MYIIGDIPDRGKNTFEILDWVMKTNNAIHIKGNHELFLQLYLEGSPMMPKNRYSQYGGQPVIEALNLMSDERKGRYHKYLSNLPLYKIVTVNDIEYVLTHSGYMVSESTVYLEDGSVDIVASIKEWCNDKETEYNYLISNDLHYIAASVKFKKLIVGHYSTFYLNCDGIYHCKRYIDIDNGANTMPGRKLACLRLEDMHEFYA